MEKAPVIALVTADVKAARVGWRVPDTQVTRTGNGVTDTVRRPQYFGHLINDIIYRRLAPGVLDELKNSVPKAPSGRRKGTYQQKLTPELGHHKLREDLASVTTIMVLSDDYKDFKRNLDKRHPRYLENLSIEFDSEDETGL